MNIDREIARINEECQVDEFDQDEYRWVQKHDADRRRELVVEMVARKRRIESTHPSLLPYEDFLVSPYWEDLSQRLKAMAMYTCQQCGFQPIPPAGQLHVHHKTYAHRGYEYPDHLGDLEVLCKNCHRSKHPDK